MIARRRIDRLRALLTDAACPGCGRLYLEEPPLPPVAPTPEMDRVFLPILTAILARTPPDPDPCPACRRPADSGGWEWPLRFATAAELRALRRAVDLYFPSAA